MVNRWGELETVADFILFGSKSLQSLTTAIKLKDDFSWKESLEKPRQCIKKQRYHFTDNDPYSQSHGFSSSHVQM